MAAGVSVTQEEMDALDTADRRWNEIREWQRDFINTSFVRFNEG
jgi:hypothetical protein